MAEEEPKGGYAAGVGKGSPLKQGVSHLILLAAASICVMPLLWMVSTSLKPLTQTMSVPPTWIPRADLAKLEGQEMVVVKLKKLDEEHAMVIPQGGNNKGVQKLLAVREIKDGKALLKYAKAGREQYEDAPVVVDVVKKCPKGWWHIQEWEPEFSEEREKTKRALRWDCVPAEELKEVPHAFWSNYASAMRRMNEKGQPWYATGFARFLFNTLFVCLMTVTGTLFSCTLVAYSFAFLDFPGKNALFFTTLAVMMVPFPATMVPVFEIFRSLGWVGSFKPLWVPAWFGGAFFIFLLRQFFLGLPKDLLDAARIDGCSELGIIWNVVVPLSKPALAMVAFFQFLGSWNDFMGPMMYLTDSKQFTLSIGLQAYQSQHGGTPWHLMMAAATMFSVPLIIVFLMARKTFMRGIAMTGIKG